MMTTQGLETRVCPGPIRQYIAPRDIGARYDGCTLTIRTAVDCWALDRASYAPLCHFFGPDRSTAILLSIARGTVVSRTV